MHHTIIKDVSYFINDNAKYKLFPPIIYHIYYLIETLFHKI
jgi:hypothetical protein